MESKSRLKRSGPVPAKNFVRIGQYITPPQQQVLTVERRAHEEKEQMKEKRKARQGKQIMRESAREERARAK